MVPYRKTACFGETWTERPGCPALAEVSGPRTQSDSGPMGQPTEMRGSGSNG